MKVLKNEALRLHTSFRVGGPAKVYVVPENVDELQKLIRFLYEEKLPYDIIGNGTNLLVSDAGVDHVVVEVGRALEEIELLPASSVSGRFSSTPVQADESEETASGVTASGEERFFLKVSAGTLLSKAAQFAAAQELCGMEALRGIPGTVGGAVTMNAGAYGTEMKDVLYSVEVLTREGERKMLSVEELGLGYRESVIPERGYIVVAATLALKKGDPTEIKARMDDYQKRRRDKQPLDKASAGSTFKRPEGYFAGKLIEDCGLRGFRHGGAQVSEKHCGFIVNDGSARAEDIYWLIGEVRKRVLMEQHVELTPEVKLWGEF